MDQHVNPSNKNQWINTRDSRLLKIEQSRSLEIMNKQSRTIFADQKSSS